MSTTSSAATPVADPVSHPPHYLTGGIETIEFIRAKLGSSGFEAYCIGNAIKYLTRYQHKSDPIVDLRKAQVYINFAIDEMIQEEQSRDF